MVGGCKGEPVRGRDFSFVLQERVPTRRVPRCQGDQGLFSLVASRARKRAEDSVFFCLTRSHNTGCLSEARGAHYPLTGWDSTPARHVTPVDSLRPLPKNGRLPDARRFRLETSWVVASRLNSSFCFPSSGHLLCASGDAVLQRHGSEAGGLGWGRNRMGDGRGVLRSIRVDGTWDMFLESILDCSGLLVDGVLRVFGA